VLHHRQVLDALDEEVLAFDDVATRDGGVQEF
jgi:hypothetical protein